MSPEVSRVVDSITDFKINHLVIQGQGCNLEVASTVQQAAAHYYNFFFCKF